MSNLTKSIPADERKMLKKAFWRSFTLYAAVSPAKQGASGFCYALMPFINKFYKNDEEGKKEALVRSMSYFNTTITCSTFIMGLVASMEKKNSEQKDFDANSINAVKSSLMGPLAGIGDSIFWGVLRVIAAGIAVVSFDKGFSCCLIARFDFNKKSIFFFLRKHRKLRCVHTTYLNFIKCHIRNPPDLYS